MLSYEAAKSPVEAMLCAISLIDADNFRSVPGWRGWAGGWGLILETDLTKSGWVPKLSTISTNTSGVVALLFLGGHGFEAFAIRLL